MCRFAVRFSYDLSKAVYSKNEHGLVFAYENWDYREE